ncbi:MAG: alpha/beta fold hydrolase [Pseudomonadota bacterium]
MQRLLTALALVASTALLAGCLAYQRAPALTPERSFLRVLGSDLRYQDTGWPAVQETSDVPLLFIHGFGSSLETWELVAPSLCSHRRCVSLDLPGFGLSSKYEEDYRPAAVVTRVLALMDQLDLPRVDVVAHSYGCSVALTLAQQAPGRVRRLVLSDGFAYADQMPWFFAWARAPVIGEVLFGMFYDQQLDWRIPLSFYDRDLVSQRMVERARDALRAPGTRAAALAVVRGLDLGEAERHYGALPHRVLIIWGREDTVTPLRYGERLAQHLPRTTFAVVPFAGHFPMVEAPGLYAETVDSFLVSRSWEDRR